MLDQDARQLAIDYVKASREQSPDAILALCSDDVEYWGLLVRKVTGNENGVIKGKAELRKFLAKILKEFGGAAIGHIGNGVSSVVVEMTVAGMLQTYAVLLVNQEGKIRAVLMHQQLP